jgi:DNA-binding NarL/FixJ family response regulator
MHWSTGIILIVDRKDEVFKTIRKALESTDYVILQVKTEDETLAVLTRLKYPIDLAVFDLDLPDEEGLAIILMTMLRGRQNTKVIVKTSRHDEPFLEQVKYFGVDAIVLKPISEEQLIETVRDTLSGSRRNSVWPSRGNAA